ncbi:hypothetical protein [Levilactobacillus sp. 244-2]|uniref:hypothetical protein n=1 Tax=Levilactobacillus sp. 244-2 TaxID=2799569 RepID=UPI00194E59CE|nr:hypothetical protein [Levilactobacillus sp. 244-2]
MAVTVDDVKGTLHDFQELDDDEVNKVILRAKRQAARDGLEDDDLDDGIIDFARHLLFVSHQMGYGAVQTAETFGNTQTNFDKLKGNDSFLLDYNALVDSAGGGDSWGEVWTE